MPFIWVTPIEEINEGKEYRMLPRILINTDQIAVLNPKERTLSMSDADSYMINLVSMEDVIAKVGGRINLNPSEGSTRPQMVLPPEVTS